MPSVSMMQFLPAAQNNSPRINNTTTTDENTSHNFTMSLKSGMKKQQVSVLESDQLNRDSTQLIKKNGSHVTETTMQFDTRNDIEEMSQNPSGNNLPYFRSPSDIPTTNNGGSGHSS